MKKPPAHKPTPLAAEGPVIPPELQALLKAEPGLVDRIFDYILSDPAMSAALQKFGSEGMSPADVNRLKASVVPKVEAEFAGETVRILKRRGLHLQVLALFDGRNASEVARRLRISRATVYRVIKQPGAAQAK